MPRALLAPHVSYRRRGPTGVELAGAIAELARFGMAKEFRTFDPAERGVILVQSAPRVLPAFPESLSHGSRSLEKLGYRGVPGSRVDDIDQRGRTGRRKSNRREDRSMGGGSCGRRPRPNG